MTKGPGAAGSVTSEGKPQAAQVTGDRGHADGRAADLWRNRQLRRLAVGDINAHDGRCGVLCDIDKPRSWLLLDEHGAVEARVQGCVGGITDICREYIVFPRLLGCDFKPGPYTVANLKHAMWAVPWFWNVDGLNDRWDRREVPTGVDEQQLVLEL